MIGVDSLAGGAESAEFVAVDSISVEQQQVADSLAEVLAAIDEQRLSDSLRMSREQSLFGERSQVVSVAVEEPVSGAQRRSTHGDGGYQIFALAIFVLYLHWCRRRLKYRQTHSIDNTYSEVKSKGSEVASPPIGEYITNYILVITTFVLVTSQLLGSHDWAVLLYITVGWHVAGFVQNISLRVASYLSYHETIAEDVARLKSKFFTLSMALILPITLILTIMGEQELSLYVAVSESIVVLCGYIFTSWMLFRSKKISNLNWILYLCAVELLPILLLWTILTRYLIQINTL